MAASRRHAHRVNTIESSLGSLHAAVTEDTSKDVVPKKPYAKAVGTFADSHSTAEPRPAPEAEPERPKTPIDPRSILEPPAPSTATSTSELREAIRKHQAHAWDPEERFPAPQTTSMQVGWGARSQPKEKVRFPKKISDTVKDAELLFKSQRTGMDL
jgi:hypothetical protein